MVIVPEPYQDTVLPPASAPSTTSHPARVLVVDDSPFIRKYLENRIRQWGYEVETAASAEDGLEHFATSAPDIVIMDFDLPGMSGADAMQWIHSRSPSTPVIFVTGHTDLELAVELMRTGALDFLSKEQLTEKLGPALDRSLAQVTKHRLLEHYEACEREHIQRVIRDENRQRAIMAASLDPLITIDARGKILLASDSVFRTFGWEPEELIGQNVKVLMPDPYASAHDGYLASARQSGKAAMLGLQRELSALRRDGTTFACEICICRVDIPGESQPLFTGVVRDISERKHSAEKLRMHAAELEMMNTRLQESVKHAERASKAKSDFLANMSHEIRTPLNAIIGYADIISTEVAEEDMCKDMLLEASATIQRSGEHLACVINDILDFSKIEAGKVALEMRSFSPREEIRETLKLVGEQANAKGLDLNIEYIGDIPDTIESDPTRLRQILINLVGNAIKFTQEGGVRLIVRISEDECPMLQMDVVDTGIGMTPYEASQLFKPFTQADESTTRRFGGTGLGLTISQQLAKLMGGDVVIVDTNPGLGTRFRVTIATGRIEPWRIDASRMLAESVEEKPEGISADSDDGSLANHRILLAEDGPDNQRLISYLLTAAGAEVKIVENGRLAIEHALEAIEKSEPFDVLLMDMQMPIMDGYQAVANLRQQNYESPIIALTAAAQAEDRERCLEAGCNDYLTKPVNRATLIDTVRRFSRHQTVSAH